MSPTGGLSKGIATGVKAGRRVKRLVFRQLFGDSPIEDRFIDIDGRRADSCGSLSWSCYADTGKVV
jgi:hypothetical protein